MLYILLDILYNKKKKHHPMAEKKETNGKKVCIGLCMRVLGQTSLTLPASALSGAFSLNRLPPPPWLLGRASVR